MGRWWRRRRIRSCFRLVHIKPPIKLVLLGRFGHSRRQTRRVQQRSSSRQRQRQSGS
jgi:hypothetical protein